MDLYLVRHGETHWNRELRLQGQNDSPLTVAGFQQALLFAQRLQREFADRPRQRLITSPLGRALQTAGIVAEHLDIPLSQVVQEPLIAERHHGEYDGLTRQEIDERLAALHGGAGDLAASTEPAARQDYKSPADSIFRDVHRAAPGGESMMDVRARMARFLASVPVDGPVVAVCHGTVSRVMRAEYLAVAPDEMATLDRHRQDRFYRLHGGQVHTLLCGEDR